MDRAFYDYARYDMARYDVYTDNFENLITSFKKQFNTSYDVTKHVLTLADVPDAVTGWYEQTYTELTIEMMIFTRDNQKIAIDLGSYVKLNALGMTVDPVHVGDRIEDHDGTLYLVKTVTPRSTGDMFQRTDCDLERLSLYREGS